MTTWRRKVGLFTGVVGIVCTAQGCAPPNINHPTMAARSTRAGDAASDSVITIVPFSLDDTLNGAILVHAEVDGRRGIFFLDTGTPVIGLCADYVRAGTQGVLDTVLANDPGGGPPIQPYTAHTLRIGATTVSLDSIAKGPPVPYQANAVLTKDQRCHQFKQPVLGGLGLSAWEPFETIIDYAHHQLVLIRLAASGHRLAEVSAYTPMARIPLAPVTLIDQPPTVISAWGVSATLGDATDTLLLDTGAPDNELSEILQQRITNHLAPASPDPFSGVPRQVLDHLILGDQRIDTVPFSEPPSSLFAGPGAKTEEQGTLGYPFLRHYGVVGFNLRTQKFVLYR